MSQKRIPVMESFSYQLPVKNRITAPPASPAAGDRYVIDGAGTGAWVGHNHKVTYWTGSVWAFDTPAAGWQTYDEQAGLFIYFDGAHWTEMDITGAYINQLMSGAVAGNVPIWTDTVGNALSAGYGVQQTVRPLGTALHTQLATELAIREAINAVLGANDAMVYKGVRDCSGNPNYPDGEAGWTFKVSVAGRIGGASGPKVEVGDMFICLLNNTASGDHATVGHRWNIIQVNIDGAVTSSTIPAVSGSIAVYDGTTGTLIKAASFTEADVNNHLNNTTNHFTQAQIDHLVILNRGVRTHANIDTHIANHSRHRPMTHNSTFKAIIYTEVDETF